MSHLYNPAVKYRIVSLMAAATLWLVGMSPVSAAPVQPENICPGLRYTQLTSYVHLGAQPPVTYEYSYYGIEDPVVVDGVELLPVYYFNQSFGTHQPTPDCHLRIEGSRVYYRDTEFPERLPEVMLYDFGLQPGMTAEIYLPKFGWEKVFIKCISVAENPTYGNLRTMTIEPGFKFHEEDEITWLGEPDYETWIIGVGSTHGLLYPSMADIVGAPGERLMEIALDGEALYADPAEVREVATDESGIDGIYDLTGARRDASMEELPQGIYIVKDSGGTRKVIK